MTSELIIGVIIGIVIALWIMDGGTYMMKQRHRLEVVELHHRILELQELLQKERNK